MRYIHTTDGYIYGLSIDGGGMRGIIAATILTRIQSQLQMPLSSKFNIIGGTSTGAIIAAALAIPRPDGTPHHTAPYRPVELMDFYYKEGPKIFRRSPWHKITSLGGLVAEKYSDAGLLDAFNKYFGRREIREAVTHLLIPTVDIERMTMKVWDETDEATIADILRGAVAAPTYFDPGIIRSATGLPELNLVCIDGGLVANNPAACVYARAKHLARELNLRALQATEIRILSIGTGRVKEGLSYQKARWFGAANWLPHVLRITLNGSAVTTDYQMNESHAKYLRLQADLSESQEAMDNASEENLDSLVETGNLLFNQNSEAIRRFLSHT